MQKVLVIAYYWPPAGGPGVQRWLKFVKYLPEFQIEPIVFVPEGPSYPILDQSLVHEIPKGIRVIKKPICEPYTWASLISKKKTKAISSGIIQEKEPSLVDKALLWIRGNFFIPDARKYWIKPSVRYLSRLIVKENIATVITTGPPYSLHLIGLGLKEQHRIQWVADFRDPWTSIGYHSKLRLSKASQKRHLILERKVLTSADKIVVTSKTTQTEFAQITQKPIKVVTNGFDDISGKTRLDHKFTISHIGSLLTGRNPLNLWTIIADLLQENEAFKKHLHIQLIGVVGEEVMEAIAQLGLQPYVENLGYMSHDKVLEVQQKSQILLLLEIDTEETKGIIPGKLFEYLNAGRPILAIGPDGWEAGAIVQETKAGAFFGQGDKGNLKDLLLSWFNLYKQGQLQINSEGIQTYHRRELTKKLVNFIAWESS